MKRYDIITFGDTCVDLILTDENLLPEFGQKEKTIGSYSLEMGGSCTYFASQTAKLGLKTAVIGKVGKDEFGRLIKIPLKTSIFPQII